MPIKIVIPKEEKVVEDTKRASAKKYGGIIMSNNFIINRNKFRELNASPTKKEPLQKDLMKRRKRLESMSPKKLKIEHSPYSQPHQSSSSRKRG